MERRIKGTNVLRLVKLIRVELHQRDIAGLSDDDLELVHTQILPATWYPFDRFERLLLIVHEQIFGGSDDAARQMGAVLAQENLTGVHSTLVARHDPIRTLRNMATAWRLNYGFGELVVSESRGETLVSIRGYPGASRCHVLGLQAWIETAVSLSGGDVRKGEIRGAPWLGSEDIVFVVRWQTPAVG